MADWYMRSDCQDQIRLARILDVAQDLKVSLNQKLLVLCKHKYLSCVRPFTLELRYKPLFLKDKL